MRSFCIPQAWIRICLILCDGLIWVIRVSFRAFLVELSFWIAWTNKSFYLNRFEKGLEVIVIFISNFSIILKKILENSMSH
jgi:hypothetical protein